MSPTPETLMRENVQKAREWYARSWVRHDTVSCVKAARAVDAAELRLSFYMETKHGTQR